MPPGIYLAEWRKHHGLTQDDLAMRMGVSLITYNRVERGRQRWDQGFLQLAAKALGVEVADLIVRNPGATSDEFWRLWNAMDEPQRQQATSVLRLIIGGKE